MRKILLAVLLFSYFVSSSQIVNRWRDSSAFIGGVSFNKGIKYSVGAGEGKILASDAYGNVFWSSGINIGDTQGVVVSASGFFNNSPYTGLGFWSNEISAVNTFNGVVVTHAIADDRVIDFSRIGVIDSIVGASAIGEFALFKDTFGNIQDLQVEFEVNNGQGAESALKIGPDFLTFGSYIGSIGYLIIDGEGGNFQFGNIGDIGSPSTGAFLEIDSATHTTILHNSDLIPQTTGQGSIGTSSNHFGSAYIDVIHTDVTELDFSALVKYATNADAITGGVPVGHLYLDNSYHVTVVHP